MAIARLPYGYYTFLRLVVCGMGIYVAWRLYTAGVAAFAVVFAIIAVAVNPLIRVHLDRKTWLPINLASAAAFAFAALFTRRFKPLG